MGCLFQLHSQILCSFKDPILSLMVDRHYVVIVAYPIFIETFFFYKELFFSKRFFLLM